MICYWEFEGTKKVNFRMVLLYITSFNQFEAKIIDFHVSKQIRRLMLWFTELQTHEAILFQEHPNYALFPQPRQTFWQPLPGAMRPHGDMYPGLFE